MKNRPLVIAFIGYNEKQTNTYFREFAEVNADRVARFDQRAGRILLKDGTEITRVSSDPVFLKGRRFDQVIFADDCRFMGVYRRGPEVYALNMCCAGSVVPEEFRWQFYLLDEGRWS